MSRFDRRSFERYFNSNSQVEDTANYYQQFRRRLRSSCAVPSRALRNHSLCLVGIRALLARTGYRLDNIIVDGARLNGTIGVRKTRNSSQQRIISAGDGGAVNAVACHSSAAASMPI